MSIVSHFSPAEMAGHQAAETWLLDLEKRLASVSPYLAPSMLAETYLALPPDQQRAFLDGIGAMLATSLVWGPAAPGKFECKEAVHLMSLTPQQQAEIDADAEREEAGGVQ